MIKRHADKTEIQPSSQNIGDLLVGPEFVQGKIDGGECPPVSLEQPGQKMMADRSNEGDGETTGFTPGGPAGGRDRLRPFPQESPAPVEKNLPGWSQGNMVAAPLQKPHSEILLQQPDLSAEGRLGHMKQDGCLAETQFPGHRCEIPELTPFHMAITIRDHHKINKLFP
jgi:hypothetical protein